MLLSRYNNIEYVMNLNYEDGINLINKAYEKTIEKDDWDLYTSIYPKMDKDSFVSFEQFKGKKQDVNTKVNKTNDEILKKAEEIRKVHQGKHKGVVKSPLPKS